MQNLPTVEPIETAKKKETATNPQEPSIKQSQVFRPKSVPQTERTQMVANKPVTIPEIRTESMETNVLPQREDDIHVLQ